MVYILNGSHLLDIWIFATIFLESFPISSSGHVWLLEKVFGVPELFLIDSALYESFDHVLHGCVAVVIALFFYHRWRFIAAQPWRARSILFSLCLLGAIAESITVVLYWLVHRYNTTWFHPSHGFFVTAALLLSLRFCPAQSSRVTTTQERPQSSIGPAHAVLFGFVQGVALLPGVSRFASTFVLGRWLGLRSLRAFEFSFVLLWPLAMAACWKEIPTLLALPDAKKLLQLPHLLVILIGSIAAFLALFVVRKLIEKDRLWYIGPYVAFIGFIALFT